MHCSTRVLMLVSLLAAAHAGTRSQEYFTLMPVYFNSTRCISTRVWSEAARSEAECALRCIGSMWIKAFRFSNGVCVLSDSLLGAASEGSGFFKRQLEPAPAAPGYELQAGGKRFWVFQQRLAGGIRFNRTWDEYLFGFGNISTDFWAGLNLIQEVAKTNRTIRIEMTTVDNEFYCSESPNFSVGDACTKYTMRVGRASFYNTTDDSLFYSNGMQFSTVDVDNDMRATESCAGTFGGGGFWWNNCLVFNSNGLYSSTLISGPDSNKYASSSYIGSWKTLRTIRMMLEL